MKSNKITVRIDWDDVINNFTEHFEERHYEKTGERIEIDRWDFHENSIYGEKVYELLDEPDFFTTANIQEGADKLFMYLENNASIFDYNIVSSYYGDSEKKFENVYRQKIRSIHNHFTNSRDIAEHFILVRGGKDEYVYDIQIDDHLENLINKNDTGKNLKILYKAKHNKHKAQQNTNPTILTNIGSMVGIIDILREVALEGNVENYLKNKLYVDI